MINSEQEDELIAWLQAHNLTVKDAQEVLGHKEIPTFTNALEVAYWAGKEEF